MSMAPQKRSRDYYSSSGPKRSFSQAWGYIPANQPSSRNGYSSGSYKSKSKNSGPYGSLVQTTNHVNPLYPPPEAKYCDRGQNGADFDPGTVAPSPIPNTGTIFIINAIATGVGSQQRIGSQITMRNISYRFELDLPAVVANQVPTSGRVMLIWDRQPNSNAPAFTDIFTDVSYLSFMQPGAAQRFVILRNQQFSLSPQGDQSLFFEGFCKINMKSTYAASTNPNSGALLLVYIGDQGTAINQPTISGCWRTRFVDN